MRASRRQFLGVTGLASVSLAVDRLLSAQSLAPQAAGRLIKSMPLGRLDARPKPPLNTLIGSGLDARQFADLSQLDPDRLVPPTDQFFVRTSSPSTLPSLDGWHIDLGGVGADRRALTMDALNAQAKAMGTHLLECSGNNDPANFGLLSVAEWAGVPIASVLEPLRADADSNRVRIAGFDEDKPSSTSLPGASWIFASGELEEMGAFLALQMNGAPLPPHHGAPVRLVVPGYYGCSCIKWINRIDVVPNDAPATAQMKEFATRTGQRSIPELARDYDPPAIDLAAMPIRVEQWLLNEGIVYRVIGIRWGGRAKRVALTIRFKHSEPYVLVDDCPEATATTTWTLWSHAWRPAATGRYEIVLGVQDRSVRTRRLDDYYYTREVDIDRV